MEVFIAHHLLLHVQDYFLLLNLPDPLVEALGWTVVHALWQGTAVALLLAAGLWLLRGRSAVQRYGIAVAAQLVVLIAAVVTFLLTYRAAGPLEGNEDLAGFYAGPATFPVSSSRVDATIWEQIQRGLRIFFERNLGWIAVLWMAGVVVFSFRLLSALILTRRLSGIAVCLVAEEWQERFEKLVIKTGVTRAVKLLESARVSVPMVIGHLKPVVLVPIGLLASLPPAQVEALLIHELAHIRRRDYLVNLLLSVLETLFFFHPAIWWMGAVVRRERECCCDAATVSFSGDSLSYAKALSALPGWQVGPQGLAMAASGQPKELLLRIRRILLPQSTYQHDIMEKTFVTSLILGAFFLLSLQAKPVRVGDMTPITPSAAVMPDSLPMGKIVIKQKKDGKSFEAKIQDGQIVSLNVDGRDVPETEFPKYEKEVMQMLEKLPVPPSPPLPPSAPAIPPTPEMPNANKSDREIQREIIVERQNGDSLFIEVNPSDLGSVMLFRRGNREAEIALDMEEMARRMEGLAKRMEERARNFAERGEHFRFEIEESFSDSLGRHLSKVFPDSFTFRTLKDFRLEGDFNMDGDWRGTQPADGMPRYFADEELEIYPLSRMRGMSAAQQIERALLRDELIEKSGMYKFELTEKALKINGDRMPEALRKKYLRLYEEASGMPWDPQNKVVIHTEVGKR